MIRYRCPRCKRSLTAQDNEVGTKKNCPQCEQRVLIPTPPPPNKTMLGALEPPNKTVLGALEDPSSVGPLPVAEYAGGIPAVPHTIIVETAATEAARPARAPDKLEEVDDPPAPAAQAGRRGRRLSRPPAARGGKPSLSAMRLHRLSTPADALRRGVHRAARRRDPLLAAPHRGLSRPREMGCLCGLWREVAADGDWILTSAKWLKRLLIPPFAVRTHQAAPPAPAARRRCVQSGNPLPNSAPAAP